MEQQRPPPQRSKLRHVSDVADTVKRDVNKTLLFCALALGVVAGWTAGPLAAVSVLTLSGVHLVYTHLWAVATIFAVCDRTGSCDGWMGVLTAMGIAITVPWYGLLLCRFKDDTVGRAINGWGRWIVEDICGHVWPYNFNSVPRLIRVSYHLVDLAVHFLPTPWLLSQFGVTPLDCFLAFLISRMWSISASAYHLTIDWTFLQKWPLKTLPRVCARSQNITPFVADGVVNDIYGLRPTIPSSSLYFLYAVEAVTLLVVAVVGAPTESMLPPTTQIEGAMLACASVGAIFGLMGVISTALAIQKAR